MDELSPLVAKSVIAFDKMLPCSAMLGHGLPRVLHSSCSIVDAFAGTHGKCEHR